MKHIGTASTQTPLHTWSLCLHQWRVPQFALKYPCHLPPPPNPWETVTWRPCPPPHPPGRPSRANPGVCKGGQGSAALLQKVVVVVVTGLLLAAVPTVSVQSLYSLPLPCASTAPAQAPLPGETVIFGAANFTVPNWFSVCFVRCCVSFSARTRTCLLKKHSHGVSCSPTCLFFHP